MVTPVDSGRISMSMNGEHTAGEWLSVIDPASAKCGRAVSEEALSIALFKLRLQWAMYEIYFAFAFNLPIAVVHSVVYQPKSLGDNAEVYYAFLRLRYTKIRNSNESAMEALSFLLETKQTELCSSRIPEMFDTIDDVAIRSHRKSLVLEAERNRKSTPYDQPLHRQIGYCFAATLFVTSSYIGIFKGQYSLESTGEKVTSTFLAIGGLWGYWATFGTQCDKSYQAYKRCQRMSAMFREKTTSATLSRLQAESEMRTGLRFSRHGQGSREPGTESTFNLLEQGNLMTWMTLYEFICKEATTSIEYHNITASVNAGSTVFVSFLCVILSFSYNADYDTVYTLLGIFVVQNCVTVLLLLNIVLKINQNLHIEIAQDLKETSFHLKGNLQRKIDQQWSDDQEMRNIKSEIDLIDLY
ncbi:hypothetical protein TrRE_jg7056, partial [Triparma retinervis]